jgi:autotransporter family porin
MRNRLLPLICLVGATAATASAVSAASAASAGRSKRAPVLRGFPKITGTPVVGDRLRASPGRWVGVRSLTYRWERCNAKVPRCKVIVKTPGGHPYAGRTYLLSRLDLGHRLRVLVRAANAWGAAWATSHSTAIIKSAASAGSPGGTSGQTPAPTPTPGPGSGGSSANYFATVPSSETGSPPAGIPRSDATCAAAVVPTPENRPQNTAANHSVPPSPSAVDWGTALNYWGIFVADRNHVTGNFTGTTDEILQWTACKWGLDVDLVRADAVIESSWVQSTLGDNCGVAGEGSYGLLQVKSKDCSGNWVHGGYPYTQNDSALGVDYWGARMRACFDGAFYNGGQWLYNGQTIAQIISQHGQDYALWGCVGSWFSGGWYDSGAQSYIAKVEADYQSKPWLRPGF